VFLVPPPGRRKSHNNASGNQALRNDLARMPGISETSSGNPLLNRNVSFRLDEPIDYTEHLVFIISTLKNF
jgi:hypothetical protein